MIVCLSNLKIKDKTMPTIVITGGSRGIGRSLVNKFAGEGYSIATCSRNIDELNRLKVELESRHKDIKILVRACDVSKKEQIDAFGDMVLTELGIPDILINNTGIFLPGKILSEESNVFESQIDTNLASAYHLTRKLAPGMVAKRSGYIFNLGSIASVTAYANGGSYTISKFGILGFSKVLREEMKEHHIRVTAVLPGATLTSSWEGTDLPDERFINPEDLASLIHFMAISPTSMVVEEILIRPLLGDIV